MPRWFVEFVGFCWLMSLWGLGSFGLMQGTLLLWSPTLRTVPDSIVGGVLLGYSALVAPLLWRCIPVTRHYLATDEVSISGTLSLSLLIVVWSMTVVGYLSVLLPPLFATRSGGLLDGIVWGLLIGCGYVTLFWHRARILSATIPQPPVGKDVYVDAD